MAEPQVLIIGAGPTGLALAAELARFGITFRLIDRATRPAQWSQTLVVQARTLEQFERYGIAKTAVARGRKIGGAIIMSERRPILHFDLAQIRSRFPFILFLPQSDTERLLTEHLHSVGGEIERGIELTSVQQPDRVEATLRHADGQSEQVSARWIVGCDGAHSTVRHAIGVPFAGNSVDFVFFLGDMPLSGPDVPGDELHVYLHRGSVVCIGRLSDTVYRVAAQSARAVVANTSRGLVAALSANPLVEAARDHVLSWLGALAFVQERGAGFVSQTAIQYRRNSLVQDHGDGSPLRAGDHAPNVTLAHADGHGQRLCERFSPPRHLLLALDMPEAQTQLLADVWPQDDILTLSSMSSAALARSYGAHNTPIIYALRPDGYISFRGSPNALAPLRDYAARVGVVPNPAAA